MRNITQLAIVAFNNAMPFKCNNTSVEVLPNVTILKLHGNAIAFRYNDPEKKNFKYNYLWMEYQRNYRASKWY